MRQPDPNYIRMIEDSKTIERLGSERNALIPVLISAWHALKSYEYGNSATDLAKEMCEKIESTLGSPETWQPLPHEEGFE